MASERIYNVDELVKVKIKKYNLRNMDAKPSRSMMTGGSQSKCRGEVHGSFSRFSEEKDEL